MNDELEELIINLSQPSEITPLVFGSTISLSPQILENSLIFTDGLSSQKFFLQDFSKHNCKITFRRCLFRIYPWFNNNFTHKALTMKKTLGKEQFSDRKR